MGAKVSRTDFEWVYGDEPHATRRRLMLKKYPEIKNLMKEDKNFKWIVLSIVVFQIVFLYLIKDVRSLWLLFLCGYFITGVLSHSLSLAIHEISHGQAFGQHRCLANRIFAMIANLPLGIPMSASFKKYHNYHHRNQSQDVLDPDIPSELETKLFTNTFTKFLWVFLQPVFYTIRPLIVNPLPPTTGELVNSVVQVTFDFLIGYFFGWHMIGFMLFSTLIVMGLHPIAGHFISEHYIMFDENTDATETDEKESKTSLKPETYSYYGPLNYLTFNVGYHVEHHDFPSIPASKLPLVRKIAPEFYETLNYHTSWTKAIYRYIVDPKIGPYARAKRARLNKNQ